MARVEWSGSRTCAPGPGALVGDRYRLLGSVVRVSPADTDSIKVRWDNGRVTIERRRNLIVGETGSAPVPSKVSR